MRRIYLAAMDGKCDLEEAGKATIPTSMLWRAELETAVFDGTRT